MSTEGSEVGRANLEAADLFERYPPPYDMTADMLFALALCPTAPLRGTFPDVPFLSLFGRTPLLLWFARVGLVTYRHPTGGLRPLGDAGDVPYGELTILALLRRRALFLPNLFATGDLSLRIGLAYGMPKRPTRMDFRLRGRRLVAATGDGARRTLVRARISGAGRLLAKLMAAWLPWRAWPVCFPGGNGVRGAVLAAPRAHLAIVERGRLSLEAAWLPEPVPLLPIGLYVPGFGMRLPPPEPDTFLKHVRRLTR